MGLPFPIPQKNSVWSIEGNQIRFIDGRWKKLANQKNARFPHL